MRLPVTAVATFEAADRPHLTKKTGVDMAATPNRGIASPGDLLFLTDCRSMTWHGERPLLPRPGGTCPPTRALPDQQVEALLERVAQDYEDIAVDLESGAVEVRHPELMPQSQD